MNIVYKLTVPIGNVLYRCNNNNSMNRIIYNHLLKKTLLISINL